jgi:hypothetical protein
LLHWKYNKWILVSKNVKKNVKHILKTPTEENNCKRFAEMQQGTGLDILFPGENNSCPLDDIVPVEVKLS